MNTRLGTPSDARSIASLIREFQPMLTLDPTGAGADQYLSSVSEEAEAEYLSSPRYLYLVAEEHDKLIGFIALRDNAHLFHLFVEPRFQRQGVARALWNQAHQAALQSGNLGEFTVNSSMMAIPVYERFGFVAAGEPVMTHGIAFLPMRLRMRNAA